MHDDLYDLANSRPAYRPRYTRRKPKRREKQPSKAPWLIMAMGLGMVVGSLFMSNIIGSWVILGVGLLSIVVGLAVMSLR